MLEVTNLKVNYGEKLIINDISLNVSKGEVLSVVGESGTGKTTLGLSLMGLIKERSGSGKVEGEILFDGKDINKMGDKELRDIRWDKISMVFQNVEDAFNPLYTILDQIKEPLLAKGIYGDEKATEKSLKLLEIMGFPVSRSKAFPHQLSLGEKQKALIAMAFVCDPEVVILDEPTSGLDVISKEGITEVLKSLCKNCATILITHDLGTASNLSDRTAVLYGGNIVELAPTYDLLSEPKHPYSRGLVRSYPIMDRAKDLQGIRGKVEFIKNGCPFHRRCTQSIEICGKEKPKLKAWTQDRQIACHRGGVVPLLEAKGLTKSFGSHKAVDSVDIMLFEGETLALIGESGAGKTTLAKTIMGLLEITEGEIFLLGETVANNNFKWIQMIFQNPRESISHRLNVLEAVKEPLDIQKIGSKEEKVIRVRKVLEEVQLPSDDDFLHRYPHELSGGEAQRIVIARALILDPKLIIADEPTSSLDASVQAKIVKLLNNIQEDRGLSMLFITHNLALARKISDRIAIMQGGKIVEQGLTNNILSSPQHPYTKTFLKASPRLSSSQ